MASIPLHQALLTLVERSDGLICPALHRGTLAHLQKCIYSDKEKGDQQLQWLRPYRFFAAIVNAYPNRDALMVTVELVLKLFQQLQRLPKDEVLNLEIPFPDVVHLAPMPPATFLGLPSFCKRLYADLRGKTEFDFVFAEFALESSAQAHAVAQSLTNGPKNLPTSTAGLSHQTHRGLHCLEPSFEEGAGGSCMELLGASEPLRPALVVFADFVLNEGDALYSQHSFLDAIGLNKTCFGQCRFHPQPWKAFLVVPKCNLWHRNCSCIKN